jgi:hypothetical protein
MLSRPTMKDVEDADDIGSYCDQEWWMGLLAIHGLWAFPRPDDCTEHRRIGHPVCQSRSDKAAPRSGQKAYISGEADSLPMSRELLRASSNICEPAMASPSMLYETIYFNHSIPQPRWRNWGLMAIK